jgi:hypothetical protein
MEPTKETKAGSGTQKGPTDLIGIWVTLPLLAWFAAILVAFFFIGAIAGIVAVIGGAVILLLAFVRIVMRADTT